MELCGLLEAEAFAQEPQTQPRRSATRTAQIENQKPSGRTISAATRKRRRELVIQHKQADGLTSEDLSRRCRISSTAIRGMIREDRTRYSDATLTRFLKTIGVSRKEWDRK